MMYPLGNWGARRIYSSRTSIPQRVRLQWRRSSWVIISVAGEVGYLTGRPSLDTHATRENRPGICSRASGWWLHDAPLTAINRYNRVVKWHAADSYLSLFTRFLSCGDVCLKCKTPSTVKARCWTAVNSPKRFFVIRLPNISKGSVSSWRKIEYKPTGKIVQHLADRSMRLNYSVIQDVLVYYYPKISCGWLSSVSKAHNKPGFEIGEKDLYTLEIELETFKYTLMVIQLASSNMRVNHADQLSHNYLPKNWKSPYI